MSALERHWARARLKHPIYIGRGMVEEALGVFRLFASWSCSSVMKTENPFDFPNLQLYDKGDDMADADSPVVLLAGPSMLNGGVSQRVFKKWAPDRKNMIVFPGALRARRWDLFWESLRVWFYSLCLTYVG